MNVFIEKRAERLIYEYIRTIREDVSIFEGGHALRKLPLLRIAIGSITILTFNIPSQELLCRVYVRGDDKK